MTEQTGLVLLIERTFDAPPEAVFDAWTNEEVLLRWFHADPDWDTPTAEIDLRVGGSLRLVMRNPDGGQEYGARGEYTVVDRPHRLAFTWVWDADPSHPQLIEMDFTGQDGATAVRMISSGIATEESRDNHREGWRKAYDNLDLALAR